MRNLILIILSLAITSCATLSKEECTLGDWEGIGNADGLKGEPRKKLADHQKACSEHGVSVNKNLYFSGHKKGLAIYCDPDKALERGLKGQYYHNVCSKEYTKKYQLGKKIFDVEKELTTIQSNISSYEDQYDSEKSKAGRRKIRSELRSLKKREKILIAKLVYLKGKSGQGIDDVFELF